MNKKSKNFGIAWASSNLALIKYWGKRDSKLNLPETSSLSISLGPLGTATEIKILNHKKKDLVFSQGKKVAESSEFYRRIVSFLNLFRPDQKTHYLVDTVSTIPIASGFASSASGFAALTKALNDLYQWHLNPRELSILARLGSGSACRSLTDGLIEWKRGIKKDGLDSFGKKLPIIWKELRIGILTISKKPKIISSRSAMEQTKKTSLLYPDWHRQSKNDLIILKKALHKKDFKTFGETSENNTLAMHALMWGVNPPICYLQKETIDAIKKVWQARAQGLLVYFTEEAGPNLHLLFQKKDTDKILEIFPNLKIIAPFAEKSDDQVILVDEKDRVLGLGTKYAVHAKGLLHRAFSVIVLRKKNSKWEILLQQRQISKYHSANLWSNTCCGHPLSKNIKKEAEKRLREEMGFRLSLKEIGKFHYRKKFYDTLMTENEIDHVFLGILKKSAKIKVNPDEVKNYQWMELKKWKKLLRKEPRKFTVWSKKVLKIM
jgi:diphosphomevalonate decarboxylase